MRASNLLRFGSAALSHKLFGTRRPLNLMLGLTDRCTGGCHYCSIPERRSPEMTLPEILNLLVEAADLGCRRLGLWGGEPLCRKDLGEIIRHAKDLGMFVTVDTNGHLIPERDADLAPVDHLNISLDGDREAHDANRGAGSFDRTMRGIEHSVGRYRFWTITVLTKKNLDQVDWILDLAERLDFLTTFQVLHHNDSLGCNADFYPDEDALRATIAAIAERKRQGAPIGSSLKFLDQLAAWPDFTKNRVTDLEGAPPCLAGDLYCNVDVDGSVYPCSLLIDETDAPNVRRGGLGPAFASMDRNGCGACAATCFSEYNLMLGLDWHTGWNWVKALRR